MTLDQCSDVRSRLDRGIPIAKWRAAAPPLGLVRPLPAGLSRAHHRSPRLAGRMRNAPSEFLEQVRAPKKHLRVRLLESRICSHSPPLPHPGKVDDRFALLVRSD